MPDKSTPTPWKVFATPDGTKVVGIGELTGEGVAGAGFGLWRDGDEAMANAALIVRAVNRDHLFSELTRLIRNAIERGGCGSSMWLEVARAVLKKVGQAP